MILIIIPAIKQGTEMTATVTSRIEGEKRMLDPTTCFSLPEKHSGLTMRIASCKFDYSLLTQKGFYFPGQSRHVTFQEKQRCKCLNERELQPYNQLCN